jgi:two-component system chemotaxis response regulator CheY
MIMDGKTHRVLVVEDDPAQRQLVATYLGKRSLDVEAVGTGRAALERLRNEHFDLLCVDLTLPDLSGFEVLEQLPTLERLPAPAVLVMSARSSPIERAQAAELGASAYLVKPFTLEALGERVRAMLLTRGTTRTSPEQRRAL